MAAVAGRVVQRLTQEAPPERVKKLLTEALLTGLRVRRDVARSIFRGVRIMQESDTYLMILEEGEEKSKREDILIVGEHRFGPPEPALRDQLANVTDLERLRRMLHRALEAASWQEILETP